MNVWHMIAVVLVPFVTLFSSRSMLGTASLLKKDTHSKVRFGTRILDTLLLGLAGGLWYVSLMAVPDPHYLNQGMYLGLLNFLDAFAILFQIGVYTYLYTKLDVILKDKID